MALLRTVASARLAAAFSLSLVLLFWFGWEIHHSVSHTLALLAASLALWIAALTYAERPTAARAFVLGLIIGIGLMAKWSFLLVVLSLGVALAVTPETRASYREPRTLLVLVGAALPILPFALWLATIDPDLVGRRTVPPGSGLSAERSLHGALVFITGIPLVFLPWIAFVLFFAWRFPKTPPPPTLPQAVAIRLASLTALATLVLMTALLLVAFATGGCSASAASPFTISSRSLCSRRSRSPASSRNASMSSVSGRGLRSFRSPWPSSFLSLSSEASTWCPGARKRTTFFPTRGWPMRSRGEDSATRNS